MEMKTKSLGKLDLIWGFRAKHLREGGQNPGEGTILPIGKKIMKTTYDEQNVFHDSKGGSSGRNLEERKDDEEQKSPVAKARDASDTSSAA